MSMTDPIADLLTRIRNGLSARKRWVDIPSSNFNKRIILVLKEESYIEEKTLTPAEKKKREEIAKAIERDDPKMPMDKKMAIATATAKRVAESDVSDLSKTLIERAINRKP